MAVERPTPRDKSIQVDLHSAVIRATDDTLIQGNRLTLQDDPYSTVTDVFPSVSRMTVQNKAFSLDVNGTTQGIKIGGQGFVIESRQGNALSTLKVYNNGRILFEFNPHPDEQKDIQAVWQIESGEPPFKNKKILRADKRFSGVTVEDPSTFENLTFGQTLNYFRLEAKFVQRELAARGNIDTSLINKYENGKRSANTFKTLAQLLKGFSWEQDDPRVQILTSKFQTEAEVRKLKKKRTRK